MHLVINGAYRMWIGQRQYRLFWSERGESVDVTAGQVPVVDPLLHGFRTPRDTAMTKARRRQMSRIMAEGYLTQQVG